MNRISSLLLTSIFFTLPALAASTDRSFAIAAGEKVHCQAMRRDSTGVTSPIPGTATSCVVKLTQVCYGGDAGAGCLNQYYLEAGYDTALTGCHISPTDGSPGYNFSVVQSGPYGPDNQKASLAAADLTVYDTASNYARITWNGSNARTISAPLSDAKTGEVVCKID